MFFLLSFVISKNHFHRVSKNPNKYIICASDGDDITIDSFYQNTLYVFLNNPSKDFGFTLFVEDEEIKFQTHTLHNTVLFPKSFNSRLRLEKVRTGTYVIVAVALETSCHDGIFVSTLDSGGIENQLGCNKNSCCFLSTGSMDAIQYSIYGPILQSVMINEYFNESQHLSISINDFIYFKKKDSNPVLFHYEKTHSNSNIFITNYLCYYLCSMLKADFSFGFNKLYLLASYKEINSGSSLTTENKPKKFDYVVPVCIALAVLLFVMIIITTLVCMRKKRVVSNEYSSSSSSIAKHESAYQFVPPNQPYYYPQVANYNQPNCPQAYYPGQTK